MRETMQYQIAQVLTAGPLTSAQIGVLFGRTSRRVNPSLQAMRTNGFLTFDGRLWHFAKLPPKNGIPREVRAHVLMRHKGFGMPHLGEILSLPVVRL